MKKNYTIKIIKSILIAGVFIQLSACGPQHSKKNHPDYSDSSIQSIRSIKTALTLGENEISLNFVEIDTTTSNPVVMIHGTPGDWETFKYVLGNRKLQTTNHLISIDRLGWGDSINKQKKTAYPKFEDQVAAIAKIIQSATDKPVILLGHSLGASLAPSVAIKHPELVSAMVLVAGTVDPKLGKPRWYNKIANLKLSQWILPDSLVKSNKEIYSLEPGLQEIENSWKELDIPVTVIQGSKDRLVSPNNVAFINSKLADHLDQFNLITLPNAGHFIPWEHTEVIINAIEKINLKIESID